MAVTLGEVRVALDAYDRTVAAWTTAADAADRAEFDRPVVKHKAIMAMVERAASGGVKLAYTAAEREVESESAYADHCAQIRSYRAAERRAYAHVQSELLWAKAMVARVAAELVAEPVE